MRVEIADVKIYFEAKIFPLIDALKIQTLSVIKETTLGVI